MNGSVSDRVRDLLDCGKWRDIEFHLEDDESGKIKVFGAHRLILASCSPVFEALCYGPLASNEAVFISDIPPDAFEAMIKYLYTDKLPLHSVELAGNLLYASKKYLLQTLGKTVSEYLCSNINEFNCFDMYNLAHICDDDTLRRTSWDFICVTLNDVVKHATKENITKELIVRLVNEPKVNGDEVAIVKLAQIWAINKCRNLELEISGDSLRNVLMQYDIFQKIQWDLLKSTDLSDVHPGLLSDDELSSLRNPSPCNLKSSIRGKPPVKMMYFHRFGDEVVRYRGFRDGITISTRITANRSLTLRSIICFAKTPPLGLNMTNLNNPMYYSERLTFFITDEQGSLMLEKQVFRKEIEYGMPFKISLNAPLTLEALQLYEIRLKPYHSILDYPCLKRNKSVKLPSGYSVDFYDMADITCDDKFEHNSCLSFISGLECSR